MSKVVITINTDSPAFTHNHSELDEILEQLWEESVLYTLKDGQEIKDGDGKIVGNVRIEK